MKKLIINAQKFLSSPTLYGIQLQAERIESKAYKEGWNANIDDKSVFTNPYGFGDKAEDWLQGFRDCQLEWDKLPIYQHQPTRK